MSGSKVEVPKTRFGKAWHWS